MKTAQPNAAPKNILHANPQRRAPQRRTPSRGFTAIEITLSTGSIFVGVMVTYFLAVRGFAGLYQIIALHVGSPYS